MSKPRGILDHRRETTIVTREKRVEEAIEEAEAETKTEVKTEGELGSRDGKRYNILATRPHCNHTLLRKNIHIPHL